MPRIAASVKGWPVRPETTPWFARTLARVAVSGMQAAAQPVSGWRGGIVDVRDAGAAFVGAGRGKDRSARRCIAFAGLGHARADDPLEGLVGGHRSVSVTAVDARAHAATSSAGRMVDRFVPRIQIPFTVASPRRVGARSDGLAREAPRPV